MAGKIKPLTQLIAFVLFVAFVIQFFRHIENCRNLSLNRGQLGDVAGAAAKVFHFDAHTVEHTHK